MKPQILLTCSNNRLLRNNMRNKLDKKLIIGFTTDPYQNIYGYSLVFFRLFDLLDRKYPKTYIILVANNGTCSSIVNNKKFNIFKLNKNLNPVFKTILLVMNFVAKIIKYDNKVILVSNGEIPELITPSLLGLKFKQTYSLFQYLLIKFKSIFFVKGLNDKKLKKMIMAKIDIFISCSHFEGFCLPVAEAMLLSKPVLCYALDEVKSEFGTNIEYVECFNIELFKVKLNN